MNSTPKDTDFIVEGDIALGTEGFFPTREAARTYALSLLRQWAKGNSDIGLTAYRTPERPDVTICAITSYGEEWDAPRLFVQSIADKRAQMAEEIAKREQAR